MIERVLSVLAGGVVYEEGAVGGPGGTGRSVWSWGDFYLCLQVV